MMIFCKNIRFIFFSLLIVANFSACAAHINNEEARNSIKSAAEISDYADYKSLSNSLGLRYSNFRSSTAIEQGVDHPKTLGVAQDIDLSINESSKLYGAVKNISWRGFIPKGKDQARATLTIWLDESVLCISESEFATDFLPVEKSYTTDDAPLILEHHLLMGGNRSVSAIFSKSKCMSYIEFYQNPR